MLASRLPESITTDAPVTLRALNEATGWLGHRTPFETSTYASYPGDKTKAC